MGRAKHLLNDPSRPAPLEPLCVHRRGPVPPAGGPDGSALTGLLTPERFRGIAPPALRGAPTPTPSPRHANNIDFDPVEGSVDKERSFQDVDLAGNSSPRRNVRRVRSVATWRGQKQAESDLSMVTDATILVCGPDRKLQKALGHRWGGAISTEVERFAVLLLPAGRSSLARGSIWGDTGSRSAGHRT
jgi:hypothetical protein